MNFYNFEPDRKTIFSPKFQIIILEDIIQEDFSLLIQDILSNETKIIESNVYENDWGTGLGKNSLTSRSSNYNLLEWESSRSLKLIIKEYHDILLEKLNQKQTNVFCQCWANVMRKGEKIKPHRHSHDEWTYLSGHICLKTKNTKTYYVHPYSRESFGSDNIENKITLFPSWMEHYTDRYKDDGERITIAFDLYSEEAFNNKIIDNMKSHWIKL